MQTGEIQPFCRAFENKGFGFGRIFDFNYAFYSIDF